MPRKPRGKKEPYCGPQPDPAPRTTELAPVNYQERLRVRCPLCGMLPQLECFGKAPYELEVKLQRFGGSFPIDETTGKRKGYMEYIPTDLTADDSQFVGFVISKLNATTDATRALLEKLSGIEGAGATVQVPERPKPKPKYQSRAVRLSGAIESLRNGLSIVEMLAEEMGSWRDNMEGTNLEQTQKFEDVSTAAETLEAAKDAIKDAIEEQVDELEGVEFPLAFG